MFRRGLLFRVLKSAGTLTSSFSKGISSLLKSPMFAQSLYFPSPKFLVAGHSWPCSLYSVCVVLSVFACISFTKKFFLLQRWYIYVLLLTLLLLLLSTEVYDGSQSKWVEYTGYGEGKELLPWNTQVLCFSKTQGLLLYWFQSSITIGNAAIFNYCMSRDGCYRMTNSNRVFRADGRLVNISEFFVQTMHKLSPSFPTCQTSMRMKLMAW